jgi:diacylglycerol kinase (ATP)
VAWLPPKLQYLELIFGCLFGYQPAVVTVEMDNGDRVTDAVYTINIGICKHSGGGCNFVPHAVPNSGRLAITIVRAMPIWKVIASTLYFYNGKIGQHPQATLHTAAQVRVSTTFFEMDGESYGETPIVFEVLPQAIQVLVP